MIARPSVTHIIHQVARVYGVSPRDIAGRRKTREIARPRQVAMHLAVTLTGRSYAEIGRMFHRDHTTVAYANNLVMGLITRDRLFRSTVEVCVAACSNIELMQNVEHAEDMVRQTIAGLQDRLIKLARTQPELLVNRLQALTMEASPCG